MQVGIMERSHRCDGRLFPSSGKGPKFSTTVDSFPSRYVIPETPQGLLKFSSWGKEGGESS